MNAVVRCLILVALAVVVLLLVGGAAPVDEERLWRHRNLGKALFENPATISQSVGELKAALDLAPSSFRERLNYGLALLRSGDVQAAITELERAQKQEPELPHTWFNLGVAYKRESRYGDAIRQFEQMAKLVPDEAVTHYNLGLLYNLTDKPAEALRQIEMAASLGPRLVAPRFQIYNVYRLQGKEAEAAQALASFQAAKTAQEAAGDSEDMEWCFYAELYDPAQARPAGRETGLGAKLQFRLEKLEGILEPQTAGLLVMDAFGEGRNDLLAWSRAGIRLYRNGRRLVEPTGLEGLKEVAGLAPGDFDNDGLVDLCVLTGAGSWLYRNVKGRFERKEAGLPAARFESALWVDFDHDYDLDLFLLGQQSVLLRNENGSFRDYAFPFAAGSAIGALAFRVVPDTKATDLVVAYSDHQGVLYRDELRGSYRATQLDALPAGARSLHAVDIDNDGWIDIGFGGASGAGFVLNRNGEFKASTALAGGGSGIAVADLENRGFQDVVRGDAVHRNHGQAAFAAGKPPAGFPRASAWASADFDNDGRADLAAVASDGSLRLLLNRTGTKNRWLRVALDGVKNLRAGLGAEIEVKAGDHYQKQTYDGAPVLFGVGPRREVDAVRITWPNGLIQNQVREKTSRAVIYKEAPRLAGSCPMVFAWNGREFQFISDVLGVAPLGASSGDGNYFPVDTDEYIQLPPGALAPRDGQYEIRITEELHEVTYLDKARLVAVDHPGTVEVFTNDKFKSPPFPEFRLFGIQRRVGPIAARDDRGRNLLPAVLRRDRVYATGFRHDAAGRAETHVLDLKFPAEASPKNRSILILNGWIDWADGSTFLGASQGGAGLVMPYLQVRDAGGTWRTVIEDMGVPSGGPKTIVVDLTGKFLSSGREIRIVTNVSLFWDEIFLSEDTASPSVRMTALEAFVSELRLRGFSRSIVDPNRERPEGFDYARWEPHAMWNPVPGLYTRYGDVSELTREADDRFVIMGSGDELRLSFAARGLPTLPPGWKRDFLLLADGWSKDADANTAFGDSVEPLPFHGMSQYPYPAAEQFPDDAEHRAWRGRFNTRQGIRLIDGLVKRTAIGVGPPGL